MSDAGVSGKARRRPMGSNGGRGQALAVLDRLVAKKKNQKALMTALEAELQAYPLRFFRRVLMPLLPRDAKLSISPDGIVEWKSLIEAFPLDKQEVPR
jgi:hypothetical protein